MDIVYPGHSKFRYNSLHNTQYVADYILTKLFLKVHEELKGTVQWNFRPLVISIIRTHLSHFIKSMFDFCFDFSELFEFC